LEELEEVDVPKALTSAKKYNKPGLGDASEARDVGK